MEVFLNKLKEFNKSWNDLPRRAGIVTITCIVVGLVWASFRYLAPFVVALVFSWIAKPIAKPLEKGLTKLRLPPKLGALIAVLLVFGLLFAAAGWLAVELTEEAKALLAATPGYIKNLADYLTDLVERATVLVQDQAGDEALNAVYEMLMSALNKVAGMASTFAASIVSFTISAVASLPDVILFVLFMIMECYYVVADRHDIGDFFKKLLPETVATHGNEVKNVMITGVRAQFVTAVLQMLAAAAILGVGFSVMRLDYSLTLAVVISVLDALPVIGAGLIMFPMIVFYIVVGDYMLAVGTMALYLIVQVVKRVMEPALLGSQLRISQLAVMVSMYAGYTIMGYIGLLIGPLMLKLFMAILSSSAGVKPVAQTAPRPMFSRKKHGGKK